MVVAVNLAEMELRVVADLIAQIERQGCCCDLLYGNCQCAIHEKVYKLRIAVDELCAKMT